MTTEGPGTSSEASQLVSSLFALLPIPIAVVDDKDRIVISNSAFGEIFPESVAISQNHMHEVVSPGRGIFDLEILPLSDQGLRIVYGVDVSREVSLRRQLSHLERGTDRKLNPRRVLCDMNELSRRTVSNYESHVRPVRAAISFDLKPSLPRFKGDPEDIEKVLLGLIINAERSIAFADRQFGTIHIRTWSENGQVRWSISDNGCGISTGYLYTAGVDSRTKEARPASLTLEACAGIIKDHGGELFCWSGYDVGSTYTVELPSTTIQPERRGVLAKNSDGRRLSNHSVLVIADDAHVTETIFDTLTRHGASVDLADSYSGSEPLLKTRHYDLIVCDQHVPGLGGDRFRMNVESIAPGVSHRILFVTSDSVNAHMRNFFAHSGIEFLRRPFHVSELMASVELLLNQSAQPDF